MDSGRRIDETRGDPSAPRAGAVAVRPPRPPGLGVSWRVVSAPILVVLVVELLIAIPGLATYRRAWLLDRVASARIALAVLHAASGRVVPEDATRAVLDAVGVRAVAVEVGGSRRMLAGAPDESGPAPRVDPAQEGALASVAAAWGAVLAGGSGPIWIVGHGSPDRAAEAAAAGSDGARIERIDVLVDDSGLVSALRGVALTVLFSSLVLATAVAGAVALVLYWTVVRPVRRLTRNLMGFAEDPEGVDRIMPPSRRRDAIGEAENAVARMEWVLAGELGEKRRLAVLGLSVSNINHELRNLLTTAQLLGDRLDGVADPVVQRVAPRLIAALDRAIRFCEATLAYGRATEPYPQRRRVPLAPLVVELEDLAGLGADARIRIETRVPADLTVFVDPEQFSRALTNIVRNAVQALDAAATLDVAPLVTVTATREGEGASSRVTILLSDNGPGLPEHGRKDLFAPFQGSMRVGGTGLGLAIASELVRLNGGTLDLDEGTKGACFRIVIADRCGDDAPG